MISCYRICQLNGERVDTQLELVSGSVRDPHAVNAHLSYGKGGFRYYDFDNNKTFCFGVFLAVVPSFNEKVGSTSPEVISGSDLKPVEVKVPIVHFKFLPGKPGHFVFALWQSNKLFVSKLEIGDYRTPNPNLPRNDVVEVVNELRGESPVDIDLHWYYQGFRVLVLSDNVSSEGAIECVECSADGQIVAWGTTNGNLLMWELASPNNNNNRCGVDEIHCHLIERSNCVHGEAVSNLDNTVKSFFPVCALEFIETPEATSSRYILVSGSSDGKIKLWEFNVNKSINAGTTQVENPIKDEIQTKLLGFLRTDSCQITSLLGMQYGHRNQSILFSGNAEGYVCVWNLDSILFPPKKNSAETCSDFNNRCLAILDHSVSAIHSLTIIPQVLFTESSMDKASPNLCMLKPDKNLNGELEETDSYILEPVLVAGDDDGNLLIYTPEKVARWNSNYRKVEELKGEEKSLSQVLVRQPWVLVQKILVDSPIVSIDISGSMMDVELFVATCEQGFKRYSHSDLLTNSDFDETLTITNPGMPGRIHETSASGSKDTFEKMQLSGAENAIDAFLPPQFVDVELDSNCSDLGEPVPVPRPALGTDADEGEDSDLFPPVPRSINSLRKLTPFSHQTDPPEKISTPEFKPYHDNFDSPLNHQEDYSQPPPPPPPITSSDVQDGKYNEETVSQEFDSQPPPPPPPLTPVESPPAFNNDSLNFNDVGNVANRVYDDHGREEEAFEIATDDSVGVNYHDISTYQLETNTEYRNGEYDDISEKAEQKTCYDGWLDCDIPPLPLSKHHEPSLNSTNKIKLALEKARLELKACNLKKSSLDRARGSERELDTTKSKEEKRKQLYTGLVSIQDSPAKETFMKKRSVPRQVTVTFARKSIAQRLQEESIRQRARKSIGQESVSDDESDKENDFKEETQRSQVKSPDTLAHSGLPWFLQNKDKKNYKWAKEEFYLTNLQSGKIGFKHFHSLD